MIFIDEKDETNIEEKFDIKKFITEEKEEQLRSSLNKFLDQELALNPFYVWDKIDLATIIDIFYWRYYLEVMPGVNEKETAERVFNMVSTRIEKLHKECRNPDAFMRYLKTVFGLLEDGYDYTDNMYSILKSNGHFTDIIPAASKTSQQRINKIFNMLENSDTLPYYLYVHKMNGEVFYVGSGQGDRYKDLEERGWDWKNFVGKNKDKVECVILERYKKEIDSRIAEKALILKYKSSGKFLANRLLFDFDCFGNLIETREQTSVLFRKNKNPKL